MNGGNSIFVKVEITQTHKCCNGGWKIKFSRVDFEPIRSVVFLSVATQLVETFSNSAHVKNNFVETLQLEKLFQGFSLAYNKWKFSQLELSEKP